MADSKYNLEVRVIGKKSFFPVLRIGAKIFFLALAIAAVIFSVVSPSSAKFGKASYRDIQDRFDRNFSAILDFQSSGSGQEGLVGMLDREKKYLSLVSGDDFETLKSQAYGRAQERIRFNFDKSEGLGEEEKEILKEMVYESYSYVPAIYGQERGSADIPIQLYFYSSDFLPRSDSADSQVALAQKMNGDHVVSFSYVVAEGKKTIASFNGYRINVVLGNGNIRLKEYLSLSGQGSVSKDEVCRQNDLRKTVIHELVHNFNSIISPNDADEALAYYSSVAVTRAMLDDQLRKRSEDLGVERLENVSQDKLGALSQDAEIRSVLERYACVTQEIKAAEKSEDFSSLEGSGPLGYQLSRVLVSLNERDQEGDLATCLSTNYKNKVPLKDSLSANFDIVQESSRCLSGLSKSGDEDKIGREEAAPFLSMIRD